MTPFTVHTGRVAALPRVNVDTDRIIPKQFLKRVERTGFGEFLFFDWRFRPDGSPDPAFELNRPAAQGASILVAGSNFGSGSSREHAPIAIRASGVAAIAAESFARIFYRNSINVGLPIVECPGVTDGAELGDVFRVDLEAGVVENMTKGKRFDATPLPAFMKEILDAGGLMPWVAHSLATGGSAEPVGAGAGVGVAKDEPIQADWRLD